MFLVLVLMPSQPQLPSSHRYRCWFLFLDFVLMRNRKNHPNNNYLGNMTFKSACPGIKRGRHLHSLKIVEIFHIELIWYISGVHNWPFLTFIVSSEWAHCLRRCFFLFPFRSVLAYGWSCVTSSFWFLGFGLAFVGLFPFSWVLWSSRLSLGHISDDWWCFSFRGSQPLPHGDCSHLSGTCVQLSCYPHRHFDLYSLLCHWLHIIFRAMSDLFFLCKFSASVVRQVSLRSMGITLHYSIT